MHHKGKVVSRTELIEHIYDQDFDRDSNTIECSSRASARSSGGRDHHDTRPRLFAGGRGLGVEGPAAPAAAADERVCPKDAERAAAHGLAFGA